MLVYRGHVRGDTSGSLDELIASGKIRLQRVFKAEIPRRAEWLGR